MGECDPAIVVPIVAAVGAFFLTVGGALLVAIHLGDWKVEASNTQSAPSANGGVTATPGPSQTGKQGNQWLWHSFLFCVTSPSFPLRRCKVPPKHVQWVTTALYVAAGVLIIAVGVTQCVPPSPQVPTQPPTPPPTSPSVWRRINVLSGDDTGRHGFGTSVGINRNGSAVAVGSYPAFKNQSTVEVFHEVDGSWERLGNPIRTLVEGFDSVQGVDAVFLCDDASKVVAFSNGAYGRVRVFALSDVGAWDEVHSWGPSNLPSDGQQHTSFHSFHVSSDCSHMVISGSKTVGEDEEWATQVNAINGDFIYRFVGPSYGAVSRSASRVVVSQISTSAEAATASSAIYRNDNGTWDAEEEFQVGLGSIVAISGNGYKVAIADGSGFTFVWDAAARKKLGSKIGVENPSSLTISDDGTVVGIAGWLEGWNTQVKCSTFRFAEDNWTHTGDILKGSDFITFPCAISGDGLTMICGSVSDNEATVHRFEPLE